MFIFSLFKSKWTWIVLVVSALAYAGWTLYSNNQDLAVEATKERQNAAALRDSLDYSYKAINWWAVGVRDLQDSLENKDKYYLGIISQQKFRIETLIAADTGHAPVISGTVTIPILGKKGIANFDGHAWYDSDQEIYNWALKVTFDDIATGSRLVFDEYEGLWRMNVFSLTPGVKVAGSTIVDEGIIRDIQSRVRKPILDTKRIFAIGGEIYSDQLSIGVGIKPSNWMVMFNYRVLEEDKVTKKPWYENLSLGVYYFAF